jgi:uncharacterized membrane protein (DUF485 family)
VTTEVPPSSTERYQAVQDSVEFGELRKRLRNFVFPATVAFFLWYALYVLLSAYARGFMGAKVFGNVNVALILGLLQFLSTFLLAWFYSRYAAQKLDPIADKIRGELDGDTVAQSAKPLDSAKSTKSTKSIESTGSADSADSASDGSVK